METLHKDLLLGAAIQLIRDIRGVACGALRNRYAADDIKYMAEDFLKRLEQINVDGEN